MMFLDLLRTWNSHINLVGKGTLADGWNRHIMESVSLFELHASRGHWIDLGTGAGIPGVVLAILAPEGMAVTLLESDRRKCAFLETVRRTLKLPYKIVCERIEDQGCLDVDVITARALAPLRELLLYQRVHAGPDVVGLYLKGAGWQKEVEDAKRDYTFEMQIIRAEHRPRSGTVKVWNVARH